MKIINIFLLCCLFSLASPAATVSVITPTRTSLTNATLPQATGGYQLGATAIGVSGLTNLTLPGYVTLGNTTNRISDDGTNVTRNGTAIGTGGSALWTNIAGILSPYPKVAEVDIVNDASAGDPTDTTFYALASDNLAAQTKGAYVFFSGSSVTGEGDFVLSGTSGTDFSSLSVSTYPLTSSIFLDSNLGTHLSITPMIASGVMASINSAFSLTNNDTLFEARNLGSQRFRIDANSGYAGAGTKLLSDDGTYKTVSVDYGFACSDETSALTTTTNAVRIQLPHAMTLTGVFASVTTPQSSGSIITVDLKEGGTSMLSTLVTIDNNETGSNTAATPAVISDTAIAQYGILVVSTTQVGTGGAGLKFWITGYR